MKIHYLAFIRMPTEKAHGLQIVKTCEALADLGAAVELVVPSRRTHVSGDAYSYYGAKRNFSLTAVTGPDLVPLGALGFLISLLWFSEKAKLRKDFWRADIIYSRDAAVLLQYVLLGRPLVYEAHNDPTFITSIVASVAKKVITISEGLKQAYVELGIPAEKIIVAPDGVDPEAFAAITPAPNKNALYVGRIEEAKGARVFAESARYLPQGVKAVMVGEGSIKKDLVKSFPEVTFLPETPYRELARILSMAQALVLPNSGKWSESSRNTSPLKLFAYMASGIPIVASDVPAIREILPEDAAVYVPPDEPEALAQGIEKALTGQERGRKAKILVQAYSWKSRAEKILAALS